MLYKAFQATKEAAFNPYLGSLACYISLGGSFGVVKLNLM